MDWFKNLKTGAKLLLGFGTMIVLSGATIAIAYHAIAAIRDAQQRLFEQEFAGVVAVVELRADLNRQRGRILEIMITSNRAQQVSLVEDIRSATVKIDNSLQTLVRLYKDNASFMQKFDAWNKILTAYRQTRETEIRLLMANKVEEARKLAEDPQSGRFEKMRSIAIQLEKDMLDHARTQITVSGELATRSIRHFVILGGLALVFGVALATMLTRLISRPLVAIAGVAERMASGDLTFKLAGKHHADEVGVLHQTFARMSEDLRLQISELVDGANVMGSAASEIVASTSQLTASANESAVAVNEATSTVEEVRQTAQMANQKAKYVADSAQKAAQSSHNGRKSIDDVGGGMTRIRQQMEAIAVSMVRLSEQSQTISQIIATVEDLSTQSNLLAVNAAIEAAKAGEHGKGFGVVAQEVRSLAEQSRQATGQVRTILGDIQKATTAAVMATEQGSKAVEAGTRQTEVAGESIQALTGSVTEAAQAAIQIAASSQQQLVGVDQVAGAMASIKQASAQNVASAKQLETAARNLHEFGQRFKELVGRYQL